MGDIIRLEGWLKRKLEREGDRIPLGEMIKKHNKWNELWIWKIKVLATERRSDNE